jgi:dTDP-4-dehydrorhamnose 3,5-epimerase
VLRGLHFQVKHPQARIVTVIHGRIFDVAVDLRPDSKSFGHLYGVELSDQGPRQLYMAPGFAHGFCMLSESADLHYKVSRLTIMLTREGSSGTILISPFSGR